MNETGAYLRTVIKEKGHDQLIFIDNRELWVRWSGGVGVGQGGEVLTNWSDIM